MPEDTDTNVNIPQGEVVPKQTPVPQDIQVPLKVPSVSEQAPINPEIASVSVNMKVVPEKEGIVKKEMVVPKKIGKETKGGSKTRFLVGCAGGFVFLFVLFIVLMVLMISRSGASNPVMEAFGLDPGGIRGFLQGVVGFSFGMLALLLLVLAVIGLFKYLSAQKSDKEKKRHNIRLTIFNSLALVFVVFIWVVLSAYIGRIEISAERVIAEIVIVEPIDMTALSAPVEVRFSANNVALALQQAGVKITGMNWDLDGDGLYETPVTDPEVTHLYNQRGTYNVGLEVEIAGDESLTEVYNKLIVIDDAVFGVDPSVGTAPQVVQFDASVIISKNDAKSIDWDFDGDGQFELEGPDNLKPHYTFEQIGDYNVQLRVIDKNNNVENYYRTIEIIPTDQPILAAQIDVTPGLTGSIPMQVRFDAERSKSLKGTITKYQWDFGDGSDLQAGKSVSYIFNEPGLYTVTLTVTDNLGNTANRTVEIEARSVSSIPKAVITTVPVAEDENSLTGILPFKVEFDASSSIDSDDDIVIYEWDFNNDELIDQEGKKVTYTFDEVGQHIVTLRVEDSEGQDGSSSMQVIIQEPGVMAVIIATPEEGTAPLVVQFDGSSSSSYEGDIVSYEWDFGDGSPKTITGAIVSHKYNSVGTYDVKLKILTNNNESASVSHLIYVREIPLRACFAPSRTSGLAPLTVSFDSKCSTGAVSTYDWAFGDGEDSTSRGPTHTFEFPGVYTVILEVTDDKSNVSTIQELIVVEGELK